MSDIYTVQLNNPSTGAIVLDSVAAASESAAISEAVAPVSGTDTAGNPIAQDFTGVGGVVDQEIVLSVSGLDANGNPIAQPAALPVVPGALAEIE